MNEVDNYDFSDGTDEWDSLYSSNSVSNKVLSNQADGTSEDSALEQESLKSIEANDVIFCFAKVKLDSDTSELIRVRYRTSDDLTSIGTVINPESNTDYELYGIVQTTSDYGNPYIRVYHEYVDATTANGKVMEIDGNVQNGGGVFAINLTKLDALFGS